MDLEEAHYTASGYPPEHVGCGCKVKFTMGTRPWPTGVTYCPMHEAAPAMLAALEPFAPLLQSHVQSRAYLGDKTPVFQINDACITVGDLRAVADAIAQARPA